MFNFFGHLLQSLIPGAIGGGAAGAVKAINKSTGFPSPGAQQIANRPPAPAPQQLLNQINRATGYPPKAQPAYNARPAIQAINQATGFHQWQPGLQSAPQRQPIPLQGNTVQPVFQTHSDGSYALTAPWNTHDTFTLDQALQEQPQFNPRPTVSRINKAAGFPSSNRARAQQIENIFRQLYGGF